MAAAVVDVRAVAGEAGLGEIQRGVAAHMLQKDGSAVVLEGVPGVEVVGHHGGIRRVKAQPHLIVRKNGAVGVNPGAVHGLKTGFPAGDPAVDQLEPGGAGDQNPYPLSAA